MVLSIITAVLNGCLAVTCATMIPFYARVVDYDHADDYDYENNYGYDVSTCVFLTNFHLT